jgi:hypothetical protein
VGQLTSMSLLFGLFVNLNKILAYFFLTLKWALERSKKQNVNGPMGLVESLETTNSKDYKNPSH